MDEYGIRELIGEVTRVRLSRRQFVVRNDEYDRLWRAAETEMDPVKRAAMFIRMNDLVVQNVVVIPVVIRHAVFATGNAIRGFDFSPFRDRCGGSCTGRRKRRRRRRPLHRGPAPGE